MTGSADEDLNTRPDDGPPGIYGDDGRPRFFNDAAVDRLVEAFVALTSEVWVLTERLATVEALAAAKGHVTLEEFTQYKPDPAETAEREAARDGYIQRVLGALRERR